MFRSTWLTYTTWILTPFLIGLFTFAPMSYLTGKPKQAQAFDIVEDPVNFVANHLTALSTSISAATEPIQTAFASTDNFKEYVLDPLAWALANTVIRKITQSIVNWINSGFQGSPAFVTDLQGFLTDVADETAGEFIYGTDLGVLCSPFELDVRIALAIQYDNQKNYNPRCTLSDVSNNVQNFINGSFTANGGWPAWFELTTNEVNHPLGAYFDAKTELSAKIRDAQGRELTLLDWGDGFFSFEACTQVTDADGNQSPKCSMTTPGSVIQTQLNEQLSIGGKRLSVADEIDEIVGALLAQIAQQAITGAMGLLGMGGNSSFSDRSFGAAGNQSYLEAMAAESELSNTNTEFVARVNNALAIYDDYIDLQFEISERIAAAGTSIEQVESNPDINQSCFNVELPNDLESELRESTNRINNSQDVRQALASIQNAYNADPNDAEARQVAIEQFNELFRNDLIPSDIDLLQEQQYIDNELKTDIDELNAEITTKREQCRIRTNNDNDSSR